MDPTITINERVDILAIYRKNGDITTLARPLKMHFHGQEITFTRLALRHSTHQGKRMVHVFDTTDNINDYRLEFDAERLTWTLISMIPGDQGSQHAS